MITDEEKRICDKEIWSRSKKMWCGCRNPATVNVPSKYIASGLDYCKRHLDDEILYAKGREKTLIILENIKRGII